MISFVIPVYKPDLGLFKKCLKSLKTQSYKDWEAIVMLDGPDSGAESVIAEIGDKRISHVQLEHGGVQKARNEGFKHTKGDIISFWDCDCVIEPDTAKTWVDEFNANPGIDFIYSGYKFIGEMGGIPSEPFDPWTLKCGNYISTMFPMRRNVFPGFDESLKSLQDWDMWLTIVEKGSKGLFIPGYAFSTAYPTTDSISGKGCTNEVWLERVKAVKDKHGLPDREVCVSSLSHREEGIRLAKLINADYKDVPNYKPNNYKTVIQVGFSLAHGMARKHSAIFNQPLKKKIIFWTAENIAEINNGLTLNALHTYSEYMNPHIIQYVEDMAAKRIMNRAGFNVSIMPMPMVNTDDIVPLPESPRFLVDIAQEYKQIFACLEQSMPDVKFDILGESAKEIKDYTGILCLTTDNTMPVTVKRMLIAGRVVVSNIQNPFCGYVAYNADMSKYIPALANTIREKISAPKVKSAVEYWTAELKPDKLAGVLK